MENTMDTEIEEINEPIESTESVETTEPVETAESTEPAESAEEPKKEEGFKPWKKTPEQNHIPYSRFKEVNEERKEYERQLQEAKARIAEYEASKKQLESITNPDDLDPNNYQDAKSYLKAYSEAIKAQAIKATKEQMQAEMEERQNKAQITAIQNKYTQVYNEAIKENPEIAEADAYLGTVVNRIHPTVLKELLSDDNSAYVVHHIATNEAALQQLLNGDPYATVKMIGQISNYIDITKSVKSRTKSTAPKLDNEEEIKQELKDSMPRNIKSTNNPPKKSIDTMTQAEYEKWANRKFGKHF